MHYKIRVFSNIWERHVDQTANIRVKTCLASDTDFEERYTEIYRSENTDTKQGDNQLIHPSITDS